MGAPTISARAAIPLGGMEQQHASAVSARRIRVRGEASVVALADRPVRVSKETGVILGLILDDGRSVLVSVEPNDEDLEFQTNFFWPDEDVKLEALDALSKYRRHDARGERPSIDPGRYFGQRGRFL